MPLFGPPNIEKLRRKGDVKGIIRAKIHTRDPRVRDNAERALRGMTDPRSVEALVAAFRDSDQKKDEGLIAVYALWALSEQGKAPPEDLLIAVLSDKSRHPNARAAAADTLKRIGGPRAVQPLREYHTAVLDDKSRDPNVRARAATALGELGDAQAVGPLIAALSDGDEKVRTKASEALERIGGPEAEKAVAAYRARQT